MIPNHAIPFRSLCFSLFLLVSLVFLASCNPSPDIIDRNIGLETTTEVPDPVFTQAEITRLNELRSAGGLTLATAEWPGIFSTGPDGSQTGFHHTLAERIGEILDVPIRYKIVEFPDFFSRDGTVPPEVRTDPSMRYDPDIFNEAQAIAFDLSVLPWREKLMDFIPILPVRLLVLSSRTDPLIQLGDLQEKTAIVFADTSHETSLRTLNEHLGLNINILAVEYGTDREQALLDGRADFYIIDSNSILRSGRASGNPEIEVSMALGKTLDNSWAVRKGDEPLRTAIGKAVEYLETTNVLNRAFTETYGMELDSYFRLINYNPANRLELSPAESAYLETIRERGALRAAIDFEQSVYELDEQGIPFGLHYNLALDLAELLELPLEFKVVDFREFFMKNGTVDERLKTDPDFVYKPDLLNQVDFYIATLSPLPWREKFLNFVELYPSVLTFMVRKDSPVPDIGNFEGWTFTVLKDTSYELWMAENLDADQYDVVYSDIGLDQARLVSEGIADISLSDSNLALTRFYSYPNLTIYPASSEVDHLSWATSRDNPELAGILEKALDYLKKDTSFETVWRAYYDMTFNEYLNIISPRNTAAQ